LKDMEIMQLVRRHSDRIAKAAPSLERKKQAWTEYPFDLVDAAVREALERRELEVDKEKRAQLHRLDAYWADRLKKAKSENVDLVTQRDRLQERVDSATPAESEDYQLKRWMYNQNGVYCPNCLDGDNELLPIHERLGALPVGCTKCSAVLPTKE
jgi:hypothetical protein